MHSLIGMSRWKRINTLGMNFAVDVRVYYNTTVIDSLQVTAADALIWESRCV